jgi:hypothetical protein
MVFDPCPHQITQVVLRAGAIIRKLKGLPEENNITILYNETAPLLGVAVTQMRSSDADHLPSPSEMKDPGGQFVIPRKDCPECGAKSGMILAPLCQSCKDSDGGKYKTAWTCLSCQYKEVSKKIFSQVLTDLGIEVPQGMKVALGIKTLTNEGLK